MISLAVTLKASRLQDAGANRMQTWKRTNENIAVVQSYGLPWVLEI